MTELLKKTPSRVCGGVFAYAVFTTGPGACQKSRKYFHSGTSRRGRGDTSESDNQYRSTCLFDWTRYEMRRAPMTIKRYREALGWVIRDIGDLPVARLHIGHVLELRRRMDGRGCGEARMASILNSLRSLLKF